MSRVAFKVHQGVCYEHDVSCVHVGQLAAEEAGGFLPYGLVVGLYQVAHA